MRIIIDGYNLFKSILTTSYISQKEHIHLMKLLTYYAHTKKHHIIIFFDSGPTFLKEYISSSAQMMLCYAGQGMSADQAIIDYVMINKDRPLLMVSNDNELKRSVALQGVESIKSLEFWCYVTDHPSVKQLKPSSVHKYSNNNNLELDDLMQKTCVPLIDMPSDDCRSDTAGLSKKERRMVLLRKKL